MRDEPTLVIDGMPLRARDADTRNVFNPATGEIISTVPCATHADIDAAVAAAERAFAGWRNTSPYERAEILHRTAGLIRERAEALAHELTLEQGKTISEARAEIDTSAELFDCAAEEGKRTFGRVLPARRPGVRQYTIHEPIGPVALFTPWNFPSDLSARKISEALAAGCSAIIKPAEETPHPALSIVRALHDAGLPKGVVNVLFGEPSVISDRLIAAPAVRLISFTGSTAVGMQLTAKAATAGMKRAIMELGGHAPVIIFEDANLEKAAAGLADRKFRNAGQVCSGPSRFYVHEKIKPRFIELMVELAKARRVGPGLDPLSTMGPLANRRRVDSMKHLVADATSRGSRLILGGASLPGSPGYFFPPTIIEGVPDDAEAMTVEPFGPIVSITAFSDEAEVVARANNLVYGHTAFVFSGDLTRAGRIADALQVGMVGINTARIATPETPYVGIKQSGQGVEGGPDGVLGYMVLKFLAEGRD